MRVRGRVRVGGVDLGDGKPCEVWVELTNAGITVRKWKGKHRFFVPIRDAASLLGVKGQSRLMRMLLSRGTSRSTSQPQPS